MMDSGEFDKLVGQIRKDYLLIQKGKVWMILGGFIGVLAAAGLISYGSAKAVLASATAKQVEACERTCGTKKSMLEVYEFSVLVRSCVLSVCRASLLPRLRAQTRRYRQSCRVQSVARK